MRNATKKYKKPYTRRSVESMFNLFICTFQIVHGAALAAHSPVLHWVRQPGRFNKAEDKLPLAVFVLLFSE